MMIRSTIAGCLGGVLFALSAAAQSNPQQVIRSPIAPTGRGIDPVGVAPVTPRPLGNTPSNSPVLAPNPSPLAPATLSPTTSTSSRDLIPAEPAVPRAGLKITKGNGTLPNEHGQVWREYDISPYTTSVTETDRPQQAVIDWILRETGTDVWFSEPLGILSASATTLRVYHTPAMQETVRDVVERLVHSPEDAHVVGIRLITVGSPDWRTRAVPLLTPIDIKSSGTEGWLLSRENAAALFQELKSRADFREHSSPQVEVHNGQSQTLARTKPRRYDRGVQPRTDGLGYDLLPGQIDEGYSLTISPLLALDGKSVDVALNCRVDQVEKLVPIAMEVPVVGQGNRVQIQVPQIVSWRLSERVRWPSDKVLLLSCGVVANPAAESGNVLATLNPFGATKSRADALLLIEHRGTATSAADAAPGSATGAAPPPTNIPELRAAEAARQRRQY
jgi:hypothetical protein